MSVDILLVRRIWFGCMQLLRGINQPAWNVDGDADVDGDGGEEHHIDMLRSSEIPSEAIVVDAARNCVTSLRRSKAQKAFSLSLYLGLSDAQTTGFTLSSGKITQMLSTKYFQRHERIFLWLPELRHRQNLLSKASIKTKKRKIFLPFPGICRVSRKSCHCCPENVKVWYFMWLKVQGYNINFIKYFWKKIFWGKTWILCVDLQIFSAESLPQPPQMCSDLRPARMYNENLLKVKIKPYIHPRFILPVKLLVKIWLRVQIWIGW